MARTLTSFDTRLKRGVRKNDRIRMYGSRGKIGKDGLISYVPRRRGPSFPIRSLLLVLAIAFAFKAFLYASMGSGIYQERVDSLSSGTLVEQAGAWLMQVDPATVVLAGFLTPLF